jgi:mono/diheme cytochrome c family protein
MSRARPFMRETFDRACAWPVASRIAWVLFSVLFALYGCAHAQAQSPNHLAIARGDHVARLVCSACHVVATDQEFQPLLEPPAPKFEDIANRPGVTTKSIRHFVLTTHWNHRTLPMTMPDLMMLPEDASDVAAYIMSLKKRDPSGSRR